MYHTLLFHIPAGIIALANAIPDMGALLVLSLKDNGLGTKEAGKVLGEMLKANSVLKELDLSSNYVRSSRGGDAPGFAQELAVGIKDNRALSLLNLSANNMNGAEAGKALGNALAANTVLKELDLSGGKDRYGDPVPNMDIAFVKAFTPGLSDNGAMTSLNLASNELGVEGAKIIVACLPKCT
jgi:Ran GTPase-activating protein (RanGAP) involved in mRNA processing and transport